MEYDIDYEINRFIDEQVNQYVPFSVILKQNNCSYSEAAQKVERFRTDFKNLLKKYNIDIENPFTAYIDLLAITEDMPENRDLQYLYICMITDCGLLNEINSQDNTTEQNICIYFQQTAKIKELTDFLELQIEYSRKIRCIKENLIKKYTFHDCYTEEDNALYRITLQYNFITENQIYKDNFSAMLNYINSSKDTRAIKPFLIFSVLTRKHGMMQKRVGFIPNLKTVFQYQEYNIFSDNGKNFNVYQSYIELYLQIKEIYADSPEVNISLCDFCFANTSPLSEWYYMWCEPDIDIPISFKQKAEALKALSFPMLHCYQDYSGIDMEDFEIKHRKIYNSWEKYITENPITLNDFLKALYNKSPISDFVKKLPYGSDFPLYADIFLYWEAETMLNETMLDTANLFTKI